MWYLLTLGGSLVVFAGVLLTVRARTLYQSLDADLLVRAQRVEAELHADLFSFDVAEALASDPRAAAAPLCIRSASGAPIFRGPLFPALNWAGEREAAAAVRADENLRTVHDRAGRAIRLATLAVPRPGADRLVLQLAASEGSVASGLGQLAIALTFAIAVVLAIAGWGSGFTVRRALAPVDVIVARARHIQANRLTERLDVRADSQELDRLVTTLNQMLDRIEGSVASARRFAADASHELQTPIAAIRGTLDMGIRLDCSAHDWRGIAVDALDDLDRLSELVRDLRLLALAEAGHLLDEREAVDLGDLVLDACETAAAVASDQQVQVEPTLAERVTVSGSARHLRRVVLNLLQNAIRYSPRGSVVSVQVSGAADRAVLVVNDAGCGIVPADLPHIFEPFYRADPARARDTGGTGLGLAIADQIVRAHGGRIEVASEAGRGSRFTMSLPLSPAGVAPPLKVIV